MTTSSILKIYLNARCILSDSRDIFDVYAFSVSTKGIRFQPTLHLSGYQSSLLAWLFTVVLHSSQHFKISVPPLQPHQELGPIIISSIQPEPFPSLKSGDIFLFASMLSRASKSKHTLHLPFSSFRRLKHHNALVNAVNCNACQLYPRHCTLSLRVIVGRG